MRLTASFLAFGLAPFLAACGTQPLPLALNSEWPSEPPSLEVATKTWTRTAEKREGLASDVELVISVDATFRSPEWRAAYVNHMRKRGKLSAADVEALKAAQQKSASEHHEFALLIATHDRRINNFAKNDRSDWTLRLRDASGAEVAPVRIYKDRRPPGEISAELPHLGPFDEIYIAEFPPDLAILAGDKFSLAIFSARAAVEITWAAGTK